MAVKTSAPEKAQHFELPAVAVNVPEPAEQVAEIQKSHSTPLPPATPNDAADSVELSVPLEYKGTTYTKLSLDLDRLDGAVLTKAERIFYALSPESKGAADNLYAMPLFWRIAGAFAAGIEYEAVEKMRAKDALILGNKTAALFFA